MVTNYDIIVIGGGINGCGIARDAAMRGLKTVLIEKHDFGSETTGASSQMIHGGARYMVSDIRTTRIASIDSGYIQKIAPHLLFRIPFLVPVLKEPHWPRWARKFYLELMETYFGAYDRFSALKNGLPHTRLSKEEVLAMEPDLNENLVGAVTFDEWGIDTNRLCIHNVLSAVEHGAQVHNHTHVTKLLREGARVTGVATENLITGERQEYKARLVVNATGPWSPHLAAMAGCEVKLRPSKGIHVGFDRRLTNYAILCKAIDGRSIFIMPYQNTTFIGTTDDDYFGDLDDVPILEDEVRYLLEGVEQVFPRVREARMTHAWAGVRPTLYGRGQYEDDLSRDYRVFDHEAEDGIGGFLSIAGGKLASYRLMSQDLVDLACKKLGVGATCQTHQVPLPGAERKVEAQDLAKQFKIPIYAAVRMIFRYGGRAYDILGLTREDASQRSAICSCDPVLEAELRYVIRHEYARSLEDLKRRTRLSLGPCQGTRCFMLGAQILGEELGWPSARVYQEVRDSIQRRWQEKAPLLEGTGLQQEELLGRTYFDLGHLDTNS